LRNEIEIIPVTGCPGAECFLLLSEDDAFLVDAGYAFSAEDTAQNIARALGSRPLHCILLTHSHYDHVGGLPVMKRNWPDAEVIAHRYVPDVFARQGAKRLIRSLDENAAAKRGGVAAQEDYAEAFAVDTTVGEGDVLRVGGATIRVMEMPGHTKCSVSYYFQEEDLLVLSETAGVRLKTGEVIPGFIVSYDATLEAIARAEEMAPRRMLISHFGEIGGDDVTAYLKEARAAAQAGAELILTEYARGKNFEEILAACTEKFYIGSCREYQPIEAFLSNTGAMIPRLIAEAETGR
jgi:glyoxylase-like metal-dependent hydrolase (beta-lactamase superfamily II)